MEPIDNMEVTDPDAGSKTIARGHEYDQHDPPLLGIVDGPAEGDISVVATSPTGVHVRLSPDDDAYWDEDDQIQLCEGRRALVVTTATTIRINWPDDEGRLLWSVEGMRLVLRLIKESQAVETVTMRLPDLDTFFTEVTRSGEPNAGGPTRA
jgi:hypothetical protein